MKHSIKTLIVASALLLTAKAADASVIILAPEVMQQQVCTQQVVMVPTMYGYMQQLQTVCQNVPVYTNALGVYWFDTHHHRHYIHHPYHHQ